MTATERMDRDHAIGIRLASTFAIHQARAAAEIAWREARASAIFTDGGFERRLRDINAVRQQIQGRMAHLETVGQHPLDHDTAAAAISAPGPVPLPTTFSASPR